MVVTDTDSLDHVGSNTLEFGTLQHAFAPGDPTFRFGRPVHRYSIDLGTGQRVRVMLRSSQVDPVLELRGPNDFSLQNDDAFPGHLDAMIEFNPPVAGRYEIIATTVHPNATGGYLLEVSGRDPNLVGGARLDVSQGTGRASAMLAPTPGQPFPGAWFNFHLDAGAYARIRVGSQQFDTVALVRGPGGNTWYNDDSNSEGPDGRGRPLDSEIALAAPISGFYELVVLSYANRGTGRFDVNARVRPPVVAEVGRTPSAGYAGPDGAGQVLGLFAGITNYTQESPLYGCADDARLLAEAFGASRLQRLDQQQLLMDQAATRSAFLAGINNLARKAGPQDVSVVFFSGHGALVPTQDPKELDGLDETLVFIDGKLTDDQVANALNSVQGTVILALDACNSGGFAEDFMTRPGRLGMFSSDPDALSATAEGRGAGGYLSYYLRHAVLGHADRGPRDGVMLAGELTDYVYEGFVEDHRRMNPEGKVDALQRLVLQRGSVTHPTLLWIYPRNADLSLPPVPQNPLVSPPS